MSRKARLAEPDGMRQISIAFDADLRRRLTFVAETRGVSIAALVREAVAKELSRSGPFAALPVGDWRE